jgi:kynurenine 3-monooxygenase
MPTTWWRTVINQKPRFSSIIVGGGLSGLLMAMYLSRMGGRVQVFERRTPKTSWQKSGRSINLLVSARGLAALRELDLEETAKKTLSVPVYGRTVHSIANTTSFVPYSDDGRKAVHICPRWRLHGMLREEAERLPHVSVHYGQQCIGVDLDTGTVSLVDTETRRQHDVSADFIIGADGTYSVVREHLLRRAPADFEQTVLPLGYRELTIRPGDGLDRHTSHDWPRGRHMLFALPNLDNSFSGTMILPLTGDDSIAALGSEAELRAFFARHYPDVSPLLPDLVDEFLSRKPATFLTVRTARWHYHDKAVLIGDACHTVVPFYGQGMNAAFQDCTVLASCLTAHGKDRESAFAAYAALRKPNTDALAELSIRHLDGLVDPVRHSIRETRHRMSVRLNRLARLPGMRLYEMVTHTTTPYAECVAEAARQQRRARWLGLDLIMAFHAVRTWIGHAARQFFQRRSRVKLQEAGHGS